MTPCVRRDLHVGRMVSAVHVNTQLVLTVLVVPVKTVAIHRQPEMDARDIVLASKNPDRIKTMRWIGRFVRNVDLNTRIEKFLI